MPRPARRVAAALTSALLLGSALAAPATADDRSDHEAALVLGYDLRDVADRSVPAHPGALHDDVPLVLLGDATPTTAGVVFDGDLRGSGSVAVAEPGAMTMDAAPADAAGLAARATLDPADACGDDSPNIAQVGRWGRDGQLKLQLAGCRGDDDPRVECRAAGSRGAVRVRVARPLPGPGTYDVRCVVEPADAGGTGVRVEAVAADGSWDADAATTAAIGAVRTAGPLSVANKAPLPAGDGNTDQLRGTVAAVAVCEHGSTAEVDDCLTAGLAPVDAPEPDGPPVDELLDNGGLEDGLFPWGARHRSHPAVTVGRSTDVARNGTASVVVAAGPGADGTTSGLRATRPPVDDADAGTTYRLTAWVHAPDAEVPVRLHLREREDGHTLRMARTSVLAGSGWTPVEVLLTASRDGSDLVVLVEGVDLHAGDGVHVDDLSLVEVR